MNHIIEYGDYMPHGMCLLWQPWLVMLWAGSDLLIFLSYMAIPFALLTVLRKRDDVPHRGLVLLFASFIVLCGLTHLLGIVTLWYPIYPWVGSVKLATGIISMITAVVLFRLIPTLVNLPSPSVLASVNASLQDEILAHRETLASLESQVVKRTAELKNANEQLAVQTQEANHRSANLLAVVGALASQSARGEETKDEFVSTLLGRLQALAKATTSINKVEGKPSVDLETIVRGQLDPMLKTFPDRVEIAGASINVVSEAAQQICLALHELATNSQKYNFPVLGHARIKIGWAITENDAGESQFELRWQEQIPPALAQEVSKGDHKGFGTQLLMRAIPATLKGHASREFTEHELIYQLHAPLKAVSAGFHPSDYGHPSPP